MNMTLSGERQYRQRWWTLVVIAISVLIVVLDSTIVNIALPTFQRELGTTISELQWIINAYIMSFGALMLTMGSLGDRFGRARLLRIGIIVFALSSLAAAFSVTGWHLIIFRGVMGIGSAMILPATLAIITNVFPQDERGKAIGIWAGLNSIGVALGPIIGGLIIDNIGWQWIFFVNLPVAVVALIAGSFLIPESRDPHPKHPDAGGTILSIMALSGLIFGLVQGSNWGWTSPEIVGSFAAFAVFTLLFIWWEGRQKEPMLEVSFFRNARFSSGVGAVCVMAFGMVGLSFALTLYLQFVRGYEPLEAGLRLVPFALGMLVGAGSAFRSVSGLGTKWVMVIGFLGVAVLGAVASFWMIDTPYWQIGLVLASMGFFMGYIAAPAADAIMSALPENRAGIGSATNSVSRTVAGSIGVAALGSALSSIYTSNFNRAAEAIQGLPPEVIKAASDSVGTAVIIAEKLPQPAGAILAETARTSFMEGWQVMAYVTCGVCIAGVFVVSRYMPGGKYARSPKAALADSTESNTAA
ncbi:MAG: MFS transporter [Dehalococcoidales bacterium]|nr:MFS transporter [Dehalococcoidales bacterium]